MFVKTCTGLLSFALLGFCCQSNNEGKPDVKSDTGEREKRAITVEEARLALNKLIESNSFLSDAPYLESLKKRIKAENKKEPLLTMGAGSSAPGGYFIGPWGYAPQSEEFSYFIKSAGRKELYSIRGCFLLNEKKQWMARVSEASVTKLTNFFGKREYEKIQVGMTMKEVIKLLGVPPGAYFAGKMGFVYPGGRKANRPYTGTAKQLEKDLSWFFASKPNSKRAEWIRRAWISNDIAIWIDFDTDRKVDRKRSSAILCPNEWLKLKEPQVAK